MAEVPAYSVRLMKEDEIHKGIDVLVQLKTIEGTRSLCEEVARTWYQIDPEGFYVAITEEGEVLGVCSGTIQHDDLVYISMFGVKRKYQERGIDTKLWNAVMDHVGDRNAALDSSPAEVEDYLHRRGMPLQASWGFLPYTSNSVDTSGLKSDIPGIQVRRITSSDSMLSNLISYDESVCGFRRSKLITLSLREHWSVAMVAIKIQEGDDQNIVCGFGCLKSNVEDGVLVSPLYADSSSIAQVLLYHLIEDFPLAKVRGITLGIKSDNEEAKTIAEILGLEKKTEFPRLYKKHEIEADFKKIYAIQNIYSVL